MILNIALGTLLAAGIITGLVILINIIAAGWLYLWHGIDDYGPLKQRWLDRWHR